MNAKEMPEKYGLKTDVKSIQERMETLPYSHIVKDSMKLSGSISFYEACALFDEEHALKLADLTLLCELAEKGERYEKAVKNHREELEPHRHIDVCAPYAIRELDEIIAESEGEPK